MKTYYKVLHKTTFHHHLKIYDIKENNEAILIFEYKYRERDEILAKRKGNLECDKYTNRNYPEVKQYQFKNL